MLSVGGERWGLGPTSLVLYLCFSVFSVVYLNGDLTDVVVLSD